MDYVECSYRADICQLYRLGGIRQFQASVALNNQRLQIAWVDVLGGKTVRPYWICPRTGKRVGVLYLGAQGFAAREYYGISYWNQSQSKSNRTSASAHEIRRKLGCPGNLCLPLVKPKGMHWKTFRKWEAKYQKAAGGYFSGLESKLNKLLTT